MMKLTIIAIAALTIGVCQASQLEDAFDKDIEAWSKLSDVPSWRGGFSYIYFNTSGGRASIGVSFALTDINKSMKREGPLTLKPSFRSHTLGFNIRTHSKFNGSAGNMIISFNGGRNVTYANVNMTGTLDVISPLELRIRNDKSMYLFNFGNDTLGDRTTLDVTFDPSFRNDMTNMPADVLPAARAAMLDSFRSRGSTALQLISLHLVSPIQGKFNNTLNAVPVVPPRPVGK